MKASFRHAGAFLAAVALTSVFCITMYFIDNKYTHEGIQPANGMLVLAQEELDRSPIHYLINGWEFYPGVLLSPDTFNADSTDRYMVYTDIGRHTRFDNPGSKRDPHGSGTYALRLKLPETLTTYALELPEIYSAYKLYINDRLYLQMGNPDPEHYLPRTQNRMVTFDASGSATILLAVTDYSHFYSGLVYPPAFGQPIALSTGRGILLGICLFIDTLGLVAAVVALYLGIRMRHKNARIFSLLCLVMCAFTSYPLLHSAAALPIFPWYALELCSNYLLTVLVVVLHNRICSTHPRIRRISLWVSLSFCGLSLCYGLCGPWLTVSMERMFSMLVFCYKAAVAAYLLITAARSLNADRSQSAPLFYASVFYATAFAWDRIFPSFEPILSGWFAEWGSLVLVLAIGYSLMRDIASAYACSLAFAEEHRQVSRQLAMQTEYARQLSQQNERNRRLAHDFRQHLRAITGLAGQIDSGPDGNTRRELLSYLEQIGQTVSVPASTLISAFSRNPALDALLQFYFTLCAGHSIRAEFRTDAMELLCLGNVELCTVMGNLLENAVEACDKQISGQKYIAIRTETTGRLLFLSVENSYDGKLRQKGERFLSRKTNSERFGIGLESVREIVDRHGGMMQIDFSGNIFQVGISLAIRGVEP